MIEGDRPEHGDASSDPDVTPDDDRRTWLGRILEKGPEARRRLARAVASLLGTALIGLAAIGSLVIWHLVRRGRLIRQRLNPPRIVRLPELPDRKVNSHDRRQGEAPSA